MFSKAYQPNLQTEAAALRAALEEIATSHIPDQPETSSGDALAWAQRHVGTLRRIATSALAEAGTGSMGVTTDLLRVSSADYWRGIEGKVEDARLKVRHAVLLNHEAAHLLAWANIARDAALAKAQGER